MTVPERPANFTKILNRHGYGLQYAVLKAAEELYERRRSQWAFEVAEFPVAVKGHGTRIDFILRHRDRPQYLLAECKRANPALANWCFAAAPYVRRDRVREDVFAEHVFVGGNLDLHSSVKSLGAASKAYHIALETRTTNPGDTEGTGRGAIEEAATQVCRGLNGLVQFFADRQKLPNGWPELVISPVIVTTANLWSSEVDLSAADLATGEVPLDAAELSPQQYVMLQYHLSPGIKHGVRTYGMEPLGQVLDREFIRTVHIVNSNHVGAFLSYGSNAWAE